MSESLGKIKAGIVWRWKKFRRDCFRLLGWRFPRLVIWCRWPWPLRKPWQCARLRLATHGGVGDELMATAVLREIKRRNPLCHLTFLSRRPEFFRHLPYLDAVELFTPAARSTALFLSYSADDNVVPPPRPLISLMAESVGLVMHATQLDQPHLGVATELRARVAAIPGPRVVVQPLASSWSPNKNWPANYWVELIKMLTEKYSVIEVGTESCLTGNTFGPCFHSFVGQTDLSGFAHVISQAAVFVGPVSGGMHLANAFEVPAVVIIGGYELPLGYQYPRSSVFYSPVPCAPCWLTKPCPYELKCLKLIKPTAVLEAICRAAAGQMQFEIVRSKLGN
jgi:ADP-heptose:LPS heptosyltransferase